MTFKPLRSLAVAAVALCGQAFAAAPQPTARVDLSKMMGRWYEVARLPNKTQRGCQAGTVDWVRSADGFSVLQTCRKGSLAAPKTEWKAKAKLLDASTNAKFKMSFFGGMISQEYWVIDNRPEQGWLLLGTPGGNYLWLMSRRPALGAQAKAEALSRIRQLGYDVGRLELPLPARD
ncbi:MAG: lipocalin family protein [Phenylobacterium sp.]|uniref:lipocalin family protein n=1 Tax=Phenylobacterium sp. TaxID=1871053 RepID=UPI002733501D|nr:lipocalin family protein [Phenylobacterium sp.]MDP3174202.1 lipocalin family protein [Phenylobacterium sp.]